MHKVFEPYRLQVFGYAIVGMSLVSLVGMPLYKVGKFFYVPGRMHKVKKPRMYASLAGLAAIVLLVLYLPLPHSVMCTLEVRARDATRVYVDEPGTLEEIDVKAGQQVAEGQKLGRIESIDVDLRIEELTGDRATNTRSNWPTCERQSYENAEASAEIRQQFRESLARWSRTSSRSRNSTKRGSSCGHRPPARSCPRRGNPTAPAPRANWPHGRARPCRKRTLAPRWKKGASSA